MGSTRISSAANEHPRQAQAAVIANLTRELSEEGFAPIVLGDMNDYDGEVLDHIGSESITQVLDILKEMEPGTSDDDLLNVAKCLPQAERYTAFWDQDQDSIVDRPYELPSIDHILIAPSLMQMVASVEMPHTLDPTEVSDHFPIVVRFDLNGGSGGGCSAHVLPGDGDDGPSPDAPSGLFIARLLPNPTGDEDEREEATIKNNSDADADLDGFKLRDRVGGTWDLSGTIAAGESKTTKRNGQRMAMGNRGDRIELLNPDGEVIDQITYGRVSEGEEVFH